MVSLIAQSNADTILNDCRAPTANSALGYSTEIITATDLSTSSDILHDCFAPRPDVISPFQKHGMLRPHRLLEILPLDDDHVIAFVPSVSRVAVLNQATYGLIGRLPLNESMLDTVTIRTLADLAAAGLVVSDDSQVPVPPEPDTLVAWLHVTDACNLRCSYCYLDKSGESMNTGTARSAIDAVVRSALIHGYSAIAVKYAGGEATLNMPVVGDAHTYAVQQAMKHNLSLQAGILSNGVTLTTRRLEAIRALGIRLMISLDGLGEPHDVQRPTIGGGGSGQATLRSIERALALGLDPDIAITVTAYSVDGLPSLLAWLLERNLRFTISFYRDHTCGNTVIDLQASEERLIAGMRAAYAVIEQQPPRWSLLGALLDRTDLSAPHQRACAAGHNYLVIDHHGHISACQMTLHQRVTSVNELDPLNALRIDSKGLLSVPVEAKQGCRDCKWRYWCAGGCPVATYRATGRYDIQSPNCAIYRSLYPDVIRLEGHRLLYWHRNRG